MVKQWPAIQETWVQSLGWQDPLEEAGNPLQYSHPEHPMDRGARGLQSIGSHSRDTPESSSREATAVWAGGAHKDLAAEIETWTWVMTIFLRQFPKMIELHT